LQLRVVLNYSRWT